jgi:stress response protein SCP2
LLADTVTDVLRLACAVSDGDVSLEAPARLRSFSRNERRMLLAALDGVVAGNQAKLGDVAQYAERWKRLGERLHPHEHPQWPGAQAVFAAARGEVRVPSLSSRVEAAMNSGDTAGAAALLAHAPGRLMRSVDWLLRSATADADRDKVLKAVEAAVGQVSGRVLLSVREHIQNRGVRIGVSRVFVNRGGRAYALPEAREALDLGLLREVQAVLDAEAARRVPAVDHLVVDPAVGGVALPLSGKSVAPGLGMLPRGSVSAVDGEWLRFFVYWHQKNRRTDYDLSALMLDEAYANAQHVSWTNLRTGYAEYSGDVTQADDGASEFINIRLAAVPRRFIIPQVYIYAGEGFDEAKEAFFGFMTRHAEQKGLPFEPRTVRAKSDLRGAGRIALPLVFMRGDDGKWRAKWLHLYLKGRPSFNQVEGGTVTTGQLTRAIVERDYLRVSYITGLMAAKAGRVTAYEPGCVLGEDPVTFVGLEQPEGLPAGSEVFTLNRLRELVPA